jgi:hypothetical protein
VELQDWLADKFERRLENEGSRDDGQKETKLIAEFRNTLRTSLLVGLAKDHAQMLRGWAPPQSQGLSPQSGSLHSQADDVGASSIFARKNLMLYQSTLLQYLLEIYFDLKILLILFTTNRDERRP